MDRVRLPDEIRPVMENGVPAIMVTCSENGDPNTTIISQAYYVDDTHVALSFQFFNKTVRNIRQNPYASLCLNDVVGRSNWILRLKFDHSETDGPVFEAMEMTIEAIASATGMSGIFVLRAADIYRVIACDRQTFEIPAS
jgi:hypothetical protein